MKKLNKFLALALGLVTVLFINSCVQDDDYTVPEVLVPAVDISTLGTKTTFAAVIARHIDAVDIDEDGIISQSEKDNESNVVGVFSTEFDAPLYIEGYVVSSDGTGNFFEEIIIQNTTDENDLAGDPRTGLKVDINERDLSNYYNFGRKVYIKLNGLAIGISSGVYTIGKNSGNTLTQIEPFEYKDFVIRDQEVSSITPKATLIADLTEQEENTLVQITDVQFNKNELEKGYAGEIADDFDGFRQLESCATGSIIDLQTSNFADFKGVQVAQGSGTITAIFSRDFRDDFDVLLINNLDAVELSNPTRCDPPVLECSGATSTVFTLFDANFQSITNEAQLDAMGWTNVNVSGGSERYEDSSFNGDVFLKISAFSTNEDPLEAWLVTPAINLDSTTDEELTFEISSNFESGKVLEAFITDNYTGDPTTTTWIEIDANIPIGDGGFGDFEPSNINISCLDGDVHVGFFYAGADGGAETRYHIDDIKVTGQN